MRSSVKKPKSRPCPLSFTSSSSRDASVSSLSDSCCSGGGAPRNPAGAGSSSRPSSPRLPSESTSAVSPGQPTSPRSRSPCVSPSAQQQLTGLAYLASRRSSVSSSTTTTCPPSPSQPQGPPGNYPGGGRRRQSNFLELPDISSPGISSSRLHRRSPHQNSSRVNSLPACSLTPNLSSELYRLRSFHITGNNRVVNCGDSFIPLDQQTSPHRSPSKHRSPQARSPNRSPIGGGSCCGSDVSSSCVDSEEELCSYQSSNKGYYRVVLLGAAKVGKSALVEQFMTSEYINTYDASLDDDFGERRVSVLLDSLESELIFIDHPSCEMSAENSLATYGPAGIIVVYSVTDRESYKFAGEILRYLWQEGLTHDKAVILVGNKCDLERARVVSSEEGKTLASSYESKFIETSSGIQHNVDELLVGTLKQCRLRSNFDDTSEQDSSIPVTPKSRRKKKHRSHRRSTAATLFNLHDLARELLGKLVFYSTLRNTQQSNNNGRRSRSCENLYVL